MFFMLSKIVPILLYPLPLFMIAVTLVTLLYNKKYSRRILMLITGLFYLTTVPLVGDLLMSTVEVRPVALEKLDSHYDAAIVLAGMVDLKLSRDGRIEFSESVDRILAGIELVKKGKADTLVISGGSGYLFDQSIREADILERLAIDSGVKPTRIIIERDSRNTYENAKNSAAIIRAGNYNSILLITSSFHMRRAMACFKKQGILPDIYPVDFRSTPGFRPESLIPSSSGLENTSTVLREIMGLVAYKIRGYI